jgi:hypothetical protein
MVCKDAFAVHADAKAGVIQLYQLDEGIDGR